MPAPAPPAPRPHVCAAGSCSERTAALDRARDWDVQFRREAR